MFGVVPKLLPPRTIVRKASWVPLTLGLLRTRMGRSAPPKVAQLVISPRKICTNWVLERPRRKGLSIPTTMAMRSCATGTATRPRFCSSAVSGRDRAATVTVPPCKASIPLSDPVAAVLTTVPGWALRKAALSASLISTMLVEPSMVMVVPAGTFCWSGKVADRLVVSPLPPGSFRFKLGAAGSEGRQPSSLDICDCNAHRTPRPIRIRIIGGKPPLGLPAGCSLMVGAPLEVVWEKWILEPLIAGKPDHQG